MTYPPAPTTFDELMKLIPPRESICKHRFVMAKKLFELKMGRNQLNIVFLSFRIP